MNQTIECDDKVMHAIHGEGIVTSFSPSGTFAVVKFPTMAEIGWYWRTVRVSDLTRS